MKKFKAQLSIIIATVAIIGCNIAQAESSYFQSNDKLEPTYNVAQEGYMTKSGKTGVTQDGYMTRNQATGRRGKKGTTGTFVGGPGTYPTSSQSSGQQVVTERYHEPMYGQTEGTVEYR